jgi:beta-glucosidase-like glycosyl hydrolase
MVGRRLMFRPPGADVTDADLSLFAETNAGGPHPVPAELRGPRQLYRLLTRVEQLGRRLLVATDHEGGRIIMLGGVAIFPDNLAAATAGEVAFVQRQGLFEGRELRRLGVDVTRPGPRRAHRTL